MRNRVFPIAAAFVVFVFCTSANSQSAIPEEKRKLISEMVTIMKMDAQLPEMTDQILKAMETSYPLGSNQAIDSNPNLTQEQKEQLKLKEADSFRSFSTKLRERIKTGIDHKKYIEEGVYPLYDKFYSEQELKDLILFYKTPTGQKVVTSMPKLFAESQKVAQETLVPQVLPLIQQLLDEEFKNIAPEPARKEIISAPPAKSGKVQ